jgi:hypothetical protein
MEENDSAASLREQLTKALEECQRQIDILRTAGQELYNPGEQPQDNRPEIALLEAECLRLKQALANLVA